MYLLSVVGVVLRSASPNSLSTEVDNYAMVVQIFISIGCVIGVYVYSFKKQILNPVMWKGVLVISLFAFLFSAVRWFMLSAQIPNITIMFYVYIIIAQLLFLPQYIAVYLYGWKSNEIWGHT